jgi:hypothetical protein
MVLTLEIVIDAFWRSYRGDRMISVLGGFKRNVNMYL